MSMTTFDKKAKSVSILRSTGKNYFDEIGTDIKTATTVEEALMEAKLDFVISKAPVQFTYDTIDGKTGEEITKAKAIPNCFATIKNNTLTPLGIVSGSYRILQNIDAFNFVDSLTAETEFVSAGTFDKLGAKSFVVIKTDNMEIMGDEVLPYILLTNSHDGSSSVKACFTPMHKSSNTPIIRTTKTAHNKVWIKHTINMAKRLEAAKLVLLNNTQYLEAIKTEAEKMGVMPYTDSQFKDLAMRLFATSADASDIQKLRNEAMIDELIASYNQTEIAKFGQNVYRATMAVANLESHMPAFRETATIKFKDINTIINGMPMTNAVVEELMS